MVSSGKTTKGEPIIKWPGVKASPSLGSSDVEVMEQEFKIASNLATSA